MSTIADYVDRTSDVAAFQGWERGINVEVLLDQSLADPDTGGEVITGIVKLAQRFLLILLTEVGSMPYDLTTGCRFMIDARTGKWRTVADLRASYNFSLLDIRRQLRQMETDADPAEERFQDATLLSVSLSPIDKASLRIQLTTQAGQSRVFIAPLRMTPK